MALLGRAALTVYDEEVVKNGLYLLDGFEPCATAIDAEVLAEEASQNPSPDA